VALITLNQNEAGSNGSSSQVRDAVEMKIIERSNTRVSSSEQIKSFAILNRDFSAEFDEVTPTMKLKRDVVAKNFADTIRNLYENK
jgi:long-chain acyl-CoA synthetase